MPTRNRSRWTTLGLPALVVAAVCGAVGWAARSPVDSRRLEPRHTDRSAARDDIADVVAGVDSLFEVRWAEANLNPAKPADDLKVLRRLSLALHGTLPSLEEIREFDADQSPGRLDAWTVRMLRDNRFADYFAERLARSFVGTEMGPFLVFRRDRFGEWLRQQLRAEGRAGRYDEMVRQMIAGNGLWTGKPQTNFVTVAFANDELDENKLAGRTVRAFLGQRIDCAQCHNHPFAEWKQSQFEGLAAYFGQTEISVFGVGDDPSQKYEVDDRATLKQRTVEPAVPLHSEWLPTTGARRQQLAAWVTHPGNRRFERAAANRIWGLVFARPFVSPIDDLPDPPEEGEADLLDLLGADFREHGYDLRRLIRVITATRSFRIESAYDEPKPGEAGPTTVELTEAWAAFPMTRLRPEQLIGAMLQASSLRTVDQNSHLFLRAKKFFQQQEFVEQYGDLGEDELDERGATIAQALLRMNGRLAGEALEANPFSASGRIAFSAGGDAACLETCYLVALSRRPTEPEAECFLPQLVEARRKEKLPPLVEDIFWSLFNSPEFSWNH